MIKTAFDDQPPKLRGCYGAFLHDSRGKTSITIYPHSADDSSKSHLKYWDILSKSKGFGKYIKCSLNYAIDKGITINLDEESTHYIVTFGGMLRYYNEGSEFISDVLDMQVEFPEEDADMLLVLASTLTCRHGHFYKRPIPGHSGLPIAMRANAYKVLRNFSKISLDNAGNAVKNGNYMGRDKYFKDPDVPIMLAEVRTKKVYDPFVLSSRQQPGFNKDDIKQVIKKLKEW